MATNKEQLQKALVNLEEHYQWLKSEHGRHLPYVRDSSGNYLVQPVVTALVNGYAALAVLRD